MNVVVNNDYSFEFGRFNQWCGQNIPLKNRLLEYLAKFFSNAKYSSDEEEINVLIDDEKVGRKFWSSIAIRHKSDIISAIRNTKTGLLSKIIKERINVFSFQDSLETIDNELMKIFEGLEKEIFINYSRLILNYERADLFEIIQKSEVLANDGKDLEFMNEKELLLSFLALVEVYQKCLPEKILVIIENIDHLVLFSDYKEIVKRCLDLSTQSETYFICSTSLNGYVDFSRELCEGVTVFNDGIYSIPDYDHLLKVIRESYPYITEMSDEYICEMLMESVQRIGSSDSITSLEAEAVRKIINKTLAITNSMKKPVNSLIIPFLME